VRESEIKKINRMGEGEGERRRIKNKNKNGRGRRRVREKENDKKKRTGKREGQCVRRRRKISLSLWHSSITLLHGMKERVGGKKMSPAFHFEES
jgi:hypothetical protein